MFSKNANVVFIEESDFFLKSPRLLQKTFSFQENLNSNNLERVLFWLRANSDKKTFCFALHRFSRIEDICRKILLSKILLRKHLISDIF